MLVKRPKTYNVFDFDYQLDTRNCICGDICRCGVVVNVELTNINIPNLIESLFGTIKLDEIKKYIVERVFSIRKLWDTSLWSPVITEGYYGQEIDGWEFDGDPLKEIKELFQLGKNEAIYRLLLLEYGYILPELNGLDWSIELVEKELVFAGQKKHYDNVNEKIYNNFNGIKGIAIKTNDGYRLIDGYHRFKADKEELVFLWVGKMENESNAIWTMEKLTDYVVVGKCSICGGPVAVPRVYMGQPIPTCLNCGAIKNETVGNVPIIPMIKKD